MAIRLSVTKISKLINKNKDNNKEYGNKIHELIENYLLTFNDNIFNKSTKIFKKQIDNFLNDRKELRIFRVEFKIEDKISVDDTIYNIVGKIDAIFFNEHTNNYVIIDWKISKNYIKNYDYEESLIIYKLLFEKKFKAKVEEISLVYLSDSSLTYIPYQIKNNDETLIEKLRYLKK